MLAAKENMEGGSSDAPEDVFMKRFKALKKRNPPADLSSVIDVDNPSCLDKVSHRLR